MESTRQLKVARLVQKDMGDIFLSESRNMFGRTMITVTKVRLTRDLSIARVYLSLFNTKDKEETLRGIVSHGRELRYKLALKVGKQLRVVPDLEFFIDDSLDYIENLEKLL